MIYERFYQIPRFCRFPRFHLLGLHTEMQTVDTKWSVSWKTRGLSRKRFQNEAALIEFACQHLFDDGFTSWRQRRRNRWRDALSLLNSIYFSVQSTFLLFFSWPVPIIKTERQSMELDRVSLIDWLINQFNKIGQFGKWRRLYQWITRPPLN